MFARVGPMSFLGLAGCIGYLSALAGAYPWFGREVLGALGDGPLKLPLKGVEHLFYLFISPMSMSILTKMVLHRFKKWGGRLSLCRNVLVCKEEVAETSF